MDCREVREQLATDALRLSPELKQHLQDCQLCRAAAERERAFARRLHVALMVPTPVGLADRVLWRTLGTRPKRSGLRRTGLLATLAAGLLVVALVPRTPEKIPTPRGPSAFELASISIDHLSHEPDTPLSTTVVPPPMLRAGFVQAGLALVGNPGEVRYLRPCPVGPYRSLHLVMADDEGPVTALYLRDSPNLGRLDLDGPEYRTVVRPHLNGNWVLIARRGQIITDIESALVNAVAMPPQLAANGYAGSDSQTHL